MQMREKVPALIGIAMAGFLGLFGVLLWTGNHHKNWASARGTETAPGECSVKITSMQAGDSIGWKETVRGEAVAPAGTYLWALERDKRRNRWYLHGGRGRAVEDGQWAVEMQFGREEDVPRDTYVAAAVVGPVVNEKLEKRFAEMRWRSLAFPDTVEGCPIDMVAVRRKR